MKIVVRFFIKFRNKGLSKVFGLSSFFWKFEITL